MEANITLRSGNVYAVDIFPPYDAVLWHGRLRAVFGPGLAALLDPSLTVQSFTSHPPDGPALSILMQEAVSRCRTPEKEALSDSVIFDNWFRKHPGDLYELGLNACIEPIRDFLFEYAAYLSERQDRERDGSSGATLGISIPKGLEAPAMLFRVCKAGLCSFTHLEEGRISAKVFFRMQRTVDWQEYEQARIADARTS